MGFKAAALDLEEGRFSAHLALKRHMANSPAVMMPVIDAYLGEGILSIAASLISCGVLMVSGRASLPNGPSATDGRTCSQYASILFVLASSVFMMSLDSAEDAGVKSGASDAVCIWCSLPSKRCAQASLRSRPVSWHIRIAGVLILACGSPYLEPTDCT